jgi:hypothetical protein
MKNNRESSVLEGAISAMTEAEMADLMKEAEEESLEIFSKVSLDSQKFDVPNFELVGVAKGKNDSFVVTYENKNNKVLKGTVDFDKARAVEKGYEPVDVSEKDDLVIVVFEKTDWHLKN